jgi:DNA-binding MarR family transcriptional regulator
VTVTSQGTVTCKLPTISQLLYEMTMETTSEILQQSIDKFWEVIPPVWRGVRSYIHAQATEQFDITVAQFHILRHICNGRDSVSKLAETGRISRPAISRGVDILVNKGLVTRTTDPVDRRHIQLALTDQGQALLSELFGNTNQWIAEKLAILTDDELEAIIQAGDALSKAFLE